MFYLGLITLLSIQDESFLKTYSLRAHVALVLSILYTLLLNVIVLCKKDYGSIMGYTGKVFSW